MKNNVEMSIMNKPYNKCFSCPAFRTECDGPRTSSMELMRWKEYMRDLCRIFGITTFKVAEITGLSSRTVENALSAKDDTDPRRETVRLIENAIIGSSGKHPCYTDYIEHHDDYKRELENAVAQLARLQRVQDTIHTSYKSEMDAIRDSYRTERQSMREAHQRELDACRADMELLLAVYKQENEKKDKIIAKLMGI